MNSPDRVTSFELQLTTADDCVGVTYYEVDEAGRIGEEIDGGWSDEPELQTEEVEITVVRASGKRDELSLTGDQHRDLENYSSYDVLFERIIAGGHPEEVLSKTLAECQEPPRSSPRP